MTNHFIKRVVFIILNPILALGLLIALLAVIALFLPFYIFRIFLVFAAKYLKPKLGEILDTQSAMYSVSGVNSPKAYFSIVVVNTYIGSRDKQCWYDAFSRLITMKDTKGNVKYPQLQQYIDMWMGYPFWRNDEAFSIKNHVSFMDVGRFNSKDVVKLQHEISLKPYKNKQSPWEFIIVTGFDDDEFADIKGPKTVIFFRLQHSLCDGFSVIKLFLSLKDKVEDDTELDKLNIAHNKKAKPTFQDILAGVYKTVAVLFIGSSFILKSLGKLPWETDYYSYTSKYISRRSKRVETNKIKEIKNEYGVSFTSVILACLTASLRKGFELKRQPIPEKMSLSMPFPVSGHPDRLCNHSTLGMLDLPIGEHDSMKRLKMIHENLLNTEMSYLPQAVYFFATLLGGLPNWLNTLLRGLYWGGTPLSHIPGPQNPMAIQGLNCVDMFFGAAINSRYIGVGFTAITFNGGLRMIMVSDTGIFNNEDQIEIMLDAAVLEMETLSNSFQDKKLK